MAGQVKHTQIFSSIRPDWRSDSGDFTDGIRGRLGLIAGNGRFPFLLLDAARARDLTVVVAEADGTPPRTPICLNCYAHLNHNVLKAGPFQAKSEKRSSHNVTADLASTSIHRQIFGS